MKRMFAEVILPLPLQTTYTYSVDEAMQPLVAVGSRVIVPFGRKRYYTGIVVSMAPIGPEGFEVKPIAAVVDTEPAVTRTQLRLWQWVADYYMCGIGDVYKAAVPAGLKLESETFVELSPEFSEQADSPLSEAEAIVCQLLDHADKPIKIDEIAKKTGLKHINRIISRLLEKEAVIVSERLTERYRARKEVYVAPAFDTDDGRRAAFEAVKNAPKQERALMALLTMTKSLKSGEVTRNALIERAEVTTPIISAMAEKGIVNVYKREINRFKFTGTADPTLPRLSDDQEGALKAIHRSWLDKQVTLLRGVTSSGKTEIYIHLIDFVMRSGRQVLYLVPEIALTTQLTQRLQRVFGDKVLIYHSKFTDNERVELWRQLLQNPHAPRVIVGARSSVFLPIGNLGLVIADEEHDNSYKQQEPAPRYNARDTAIMLAMMHGAKTLLGSATPSIETYYKATTGKYGLVELDKRYGDLPLPEVDMVDMREARERGGFSGILAPTTRQAIEDTLTAGNQAIVFLNRRGYAPMAVCRTCGYIPKCEHCDVSLTYHKGLSPTLVCHYCGANYPVPSICPACHEPSIEIVGYGTERVEDEISMSFPKAKIARMDLDTTRAKDSYAHIIDDFSAGRTNLLVGTQMVTKGLDFGKVGTVAVVNADAVLHYPDFRSSEQAFSMIEQVAGRAGRAGADSKVMVQTRDIDNPVFDFIRSHDYRGFYEQEIAQREQFGYPPMTRLIYIYLKHADRQLLADIATVYGRRLRSLFGSRVSGPEEPSISRVRSLYIRRLMLKLEPSASAPKAKQLLRDLRDSMLADPSIRGVVIYYDVDPA